MKLTRRNAEEEPAPAVEESDSSVGKGRPTPKRRDVVGARGPVTAPKTRKEAYARQKELAKAQRAVRTTSSTTASTRLTPAQRRELMKSGDASVLPKRDQGATRKLARDYVDSHRMFSNYLLVLFPLIVFGYFVSFLQLLVLILFLGLLVEWFLVGRRVRKLAIERDGEAQSSNLMIGFYAGSRAYIPRRWRLPAPQVSLGDDI